MDVIATGAVGRIEDSCPLLRRSAPFSVLRVSHKGYHDAVLVLVPGWLEGPQAKCGAAPKLGEGALVSN